MHIAALLSVFHYFIIIILTGLQQQRFVIFSHAVRLPFDNLLQSARPTVLNTTPATKWKLPFGHQRRILHERRCRATMFGFMSTVAANLLLDLVP